VTIARVFGLTFGIKLMENGEGSAQVNYGALGSELEEAILIANDEQEQG